MKLRNKKTGEIVDYISFKECGGGQICMYVFDTSKHYYYDSLSKLNEEWEDVPEEPKEYWYIYADKPQRADCGDILEEDFKSIGNYFETGEEAKKAVERLRAWKRLKEAGFKFDGWKRDERYCGDFVITATDQTSCNDKDLDLLFGGEE